MLAMGIQKSCLFFLLYQWCEYIVENKCIFNVIVHEEQKLYFDGKILCFTFLDKRIILLIDLKKNR